MPHVEINIQHFSNSICTKSIFTQRIEDVYPIQSLDAFVQKNNYYMSANTFFKQLAAISIPTAIAVYLVHTIPLLAPYSLLSWISILLFIGLCIFMFYVGRKTALSENKNTFTNAFLLFLMIKLFSCAILVIVYLKVVEPSTKLFVLPFFGLYVIYTTFEVIFLSKLGRLKTT